MRYIKRIDELFGLFKSTETKLKEFGIKNYTINSDGTIDVDGNINLVDEGLDVMPFKFGKVTGYFYISRNKLTSLEGSPREVGGSFICSNNNLKNLLGGPQEVGFHYYCDNNKLETLEGCAGDIGGYLDCSNNKLTSLDCSSVVVGDIYCRGNGFDTEPEFFGVCDGEIIYKNDNRLTSLEGLPVVIRGDFNLTNNQLTSLSENHYIDIEKEYDSIGNYAELLKDKFKNKDLYKQILGKYLTDYNPNVSVSNAVNCIDLEVDKRQLIKELESRLDESFSEDLRQNTILGKGGFNTFLKMLSALNIEVVEDIKNCPKDFVILYDYVGIPKERVSVVLKRFKSLSHIINNLTDNNGLYFGVKWESKLMIEYGYITDEKRNKIGEFVLNKSSLLEILDMNNKNINKFKETFNDINIENLMILNKIKIECLEYNPGHHKSKSNPIIHLKDGILEFGIYGLGQWDGPHLKDGELDKHKSSFKLWINSKKWKDKVLVSVKSDSFWFRFKIKLK